MSLMKSINTTSKELAYRDKHFHDIQVIKNRQVTCTSCGNILKIKLGHIFSHPLLGLLQCETCQKHFKDIDKASDKQICCHICGRNKKIYVCSDEDCSSGFCKYCIKRNTTLSLLDAEHKDWKCFICNSKPLWKLRAVCAAVMNTFPKCNKRSFDIQKRTLPSLKEKIKKTIRVQRALEVLCDKEDDSTSDPRPSFSAKEFTREANNKDHRRSPALEITITDSSDITSESDIDKRKKTKRDKKVQPISNSTDSNSSFYVSKSAINRKNVSKRNKDLSDSDNSLIVLADETTKRQHTKRSHSRSIEKQKIRNRTTDSSDSESDRDSSTTRMLKIFNSSSKHATQQKKKDADSRNSRTAKNKIKKYHDSTSKSDGEDVECAKQSKEKYSSNSITSHNSNEMQKQEKCDNSKGKLLQMIREDNSDSSSKEFQKEKLLRNKYSSMRQLKDLDVDYTKSTTGENSSSEKVKHTKDNDEQLDLTLNDIKKVLKECKSICSSFQKYIEIIEGLYEKEDEENLLLLSIGKVNKLTTMLNKKQKDLATFHESWSKRPKSSRSAPKKMHKEVSCNEQPPEEKTDTHMKRKMHEDKPRNSENEQDSKEVSECDSDEIFSADESRSPRKINTTRDTDMSKVDNRASSDVDKTDDEDEQQTTNKSKDSEKNNENSRDSLIASPILGTLEQKKASAEGSNKQMIPECVNNADNKAQSKNRNTDSEIDKSELVNPNNYDNKTDDSSLKEINEKATSQDKNARNNLTAVKYMINESIDDMFESSFESEHVKDNPQGTDIETHNDKAEHTTKLTNIDTRDTSLKEEANHAAGDFENDKIQGENTGSKTFSPERNEKEMGSMSHNNPEEITLATNNENGDNVNNSRQEKAVSEKVDADDTESLEMAEALAKETLLESDSENATSNGSPHDASLTKKNRKEGETQEIDSDVSTVIVFRSPKNKNAADDTNVEVETNAIKSNVSKSNDKPNKDTCDKTTSSSDEDVKAEEAAKKALLACSTSDDSTTSQSRKVEEAATNSKKSELDANIKAKKALLASSNSDSSSDVQISETDANISGNGRKNKRNREHDSDSNSMLSTVKRRRLHLHKNVHYMNDTKLRMTCEVRVTSLSKKILKRYAHALQKSKQYLEHKTLKSLVNLDKLEKRHKHTRKGSDTSTGDDDALSKISRKSNKGRGKQTTKEAEESLMDHLKRVENDDLSTIQTVYSSDESVDRVAKVDAAPMSNEALMLEANKAAKQNLLNSDSDDMEKAMVSDNDNSTNHDDKNEKTEDKKKKSQKKSEEKNSKQELMSKKDKSEKSNWRRSKILTMKLSDTDSEAERGKWEKKQEKLIKKQEINTDSDEGEESMIKRKKKKGGRRILYSDSDVKLTDCDSNDSSKASDTKRNSSDSVISLGSVNAKKDKEKLKRKGRKRRDSKSSDTDSSFEEKRSKPKRKRIKKMASDSDSSDTIQTSQGTPGKSGRKNIRKVLKDKQVAEDTKQAAKEEEERLKRIAERQALYNEMYEMRLAGEEKIDKLVLDFDTETKEELVSVHEDLVKRLKPHQAQGIKFMWDACFESLERIKSTSGSGCIIAHCMGLGKTLQVVALTHTLLNHETTDIKTVLIVCPLSTVLNWANEYKIWLADMDDDVNVYELTKFKRNFERKCQLQRWQKTGGVLIIGYEMFRNLTGSNKNIRKGMKEALLECLIDPGPDLIVCDEGHLLKNEDTALSKCIRKVRTMRRIVLTGTPLQNNLIEYHCMVQFVKPNLLGTKKEFLNRFVNPITNGQFDDSTAYDVKLMKKRAHVLHKMLEGSVQRFDYSVLTPFLPPKQEYVIFVRLTETQIKMYQYYLDNLARRHHGTGGSLFADFQALQRVWTHPIVLRLNAEKIEKANEKKGFSSDTEGSLKDFINDDSTESESSSSESSNDSDIQTIDETKDNTNIPRRKTRNNPGVEEPEPEEPSPKEGEETVEWWSQFVQPEHFEDMKVSAKLLLLFGILKECEQIGDKVLVFSQSLYSLTLIEEFLRRIDDETQNNKHLESLDNHTGNWSLGLDYFRLDGQTSADNRSAWCRIFNKPTNTRARLFLISTRAGGLGINLTAANRVIIFDASWNPSHDVQSIFRIYRFGQKKPCYVYRFLAAKTMEEKIYNRQVTKLSLSCRVVDEQQIERHYSNQNLNELYKFEAYDTERPTLNLPKDRLLAEIFLKYKDVVENYHEHDSLLENKAEEELDEEERKQAWLEYEEEKKGKPMVVAYPNNVFQHQYNMMMNAEQAGLLPQNFSLQAEYENLQQLICKDFPNATLEQQKMMTNRALVEMYNYWERQAVLQPVANRVPFRTYQSRFPVPQAATSSNAHQQLNQLLTGGQSVNYMNVNQSAQSGVNVLQKQFTYRNVPSNNTGKTDDDIIEVVTPSTSNAGALNTQVAQTVQPAATNKNQEE
ncbi:transcriptional regulator ATRX isoform X3 [Harpegnathos saltator]|uniref:transcriptional regulator ATRX isoform X3 n=1 Tax=Harpegnathos saltator TaxID=610380 RepID=UPI0005911611|nr:transcriptional regulator ATRX isoform X3 [Harpegnathos saltator]